MVRELGVVVMGRKGLVLSSDPDNQSPDCRGHGAVGASREVGDVETQKC